MELLEQKKTTQPHEQDPKDDLLDHRRTQVATIGPKPRGRRRWLWLKDESLEDSAIKSEISDQMSEVRRIEDLQAALAQFAE
jgi:hypothetical protein